MHAGDDKPHFIRQLEDECVRQSEVAEFVVEVHPPDSHVSWFIDNNEVNTNEKYQLTSYGSVHVLEIYDTSEKDQTTVSAKVGEDITSARLIVEGEYLLPSIINFLL